MDNLLIRPYKETDSHTISEMFNQFIDYLDVLDPMRRVVRHPEYGVKVLTNTLHEVAEKDGTFLIAEIDGNIIGFGVAVINKLSEEDLLETFPHVPGRVTELFVDVRYRGKGVGSRIMSDMEAYLKEKGCQTVHIEVFAPNIKTHRLYQRLGYADRNIDLIKIL